MGALKINYTIQMAPLIYISLLILELFFLAGVTIYLAFLIYSSMMGSPYVPTTAKQTESLLALIKPKRKTKILELGCGDGRFLRIAAKKYHCVGLGIDINPVVLLKARILSNVNKLKNVKFENRNIFKQSFVGYVLLYLFLMPKLLGQLAPQLKKEMMPSTLVISHGFKIPTCDRYITRVVQSHPFDSYFYRFPKPKR